MKLLIFTTAMMFMVGCKGREHKQDLVFAYHVRVSKFCDDCASTFWKVMYTVDNWETSYAITEYNEELYGVSNIKRATVVFPDVDDAKKFALLFNTYSKVVAHDSIQENVVRPPLLKKQSILKNGLDVY